MLNPNPRSKNINEKERKQNKIKSNFHDSDRGNICQRINNRKKALVGKLMVNKVLEKLWMYLMVDFITKLLIVYNRLLKIAYFVATTEETLVKELAMLFRDNM